MKQIKKLTPFKHVCMTIGNLPSSYIDSMSYYETLLWLCKFLKDEVIPTVNNNSEVVAELQNFVIHYFDNLDVQEEINNKLDAMAESGELVSSFSKYLSFVTPEMFGAIGDGETDDTEAIQNAINSARDNKVKVMLFSKSYLISSSLTIYTNVEIDGNNATIKTNENIKMIISPGCSYINIHDLKLIGNNGDENYGIFISSYFSNYKNITIGKVKTGIHIDSSQVAGTLVENRLENIKVYQYDYAGLYLGDNNNAKITDGYLINTILSANPNASYGIFIGSSAGWCVNGAHIYGYNNNAVQLNNSNATNVSNIYIEYFKNFGLVMASTQTGNNVSNIYVRHNVDGATGDAIHVEVSAFLPANTHSGNLSNINILRGNVTTGKSINIAGGYVNAWNASNVIIDSTANKTIANDCSGINYNYQGLHYENEAKLSLNNSQTLFNYISTYNYKGFNQNTTSIDIDLPTLGNLVPSAIKITAVGGRFTSQSGVFYTGEIYFVKDTNGLLHAWIKNNDTNTIFATDPTISVDDANNKLTLSFTVNSSLYGRIYYNILT